MSPELDERLSSSYPLLYSRRWNDETETCMCWGFECGDGWYRIIDDLSDNLESINERMLSEAESEKRLVLLSVLSFFFCLGFVVVYASNLMLSGKSGDPLAASLLFLAGAASLWVIIKNRKSKPPVLIEASQVKEKFGILRFYVGPIDERHHEEVNDLIKNAENRSAFTCEYCGKPGGTRPAAWIKTLCDECSSKWVLPGR